MDLPYLTVDFPGIGGSIKQRPEDFFVQEVPIYEPSGEGEHVFVEIQKVGLTTFEAIHRIAAALRVSSRDIGYAGLKDAQAVTRQVISIPGTTPEAVMQLQVERMQVLWAARHGNKLRLGHLRGNRFAIKIRNITPTDVVKLRPVVDELVRRGMPNYYGEQRFGRRGNNDALGAALIRGDNTTLMRLLLGSPDPAIDDAQTLGARKAFDERDNELAMRLMPRVHGLERRVLARLIKTRKLGAAARAIDEKLRRLWVSALQSRVFNDVLARRVADATSDRLIEGDLAMKHENGACFPVEDVEKEQPRCESFEISPTGPVVGYRMTLPAGQALAIEEQAFAARELTRESFRETRERARGDRRALRVKPEDVQLEGGMDEHGEFITVAFTLPAGAYATMFLRELMKNDLSPSPGTLGEGPSSIDGEAAEPSPQPSP